MGVLDVLPQNFFYENTVIRTRLFPVDISGLTSLSPIIQETEIGSRIFCPD